MKGIYEQLQKSNVTPYSKLTLQTLKETLDEIYNTGRIIIRRELDDLKNITSEEYENIKTLLYSDLDEDYILAQEIINNLKNN